MNYHARNRLPIPFRFLEPTFYSGLLDDPVLLLRNRPAGNNILIDCGQIHHIAKRVLKAVDAICISHAHMDHFMGLASFARNILVSTKTVDIYGPPDLSIRLEHLLGGFDWNLCENFWCCFRVHEIYPDEISTFLLSGPNGFKREPEKTRGTENNIILSNNQFKISVATCDHKIPSLIYRVEEHPVFLIDDNRLLEKNFVRGDWLRELNKRFNQGLLNQGPITVLYKRGEKTEEAIIEAPATFYWDICADQQTLSIGYVTDAGFTEQNRKTINSFLQGITLLVCECTYIADDLDKARASYHLCTTDLNRLMHELQPQYVLPIHISKSYRTETDRIFMELEPPDQTTLLRLPDHIAPRPLLSNEIPGPEAIQ